jgi:iron complex outermembrane receptor protein
MTMLVLRRVATVVILLGSPGWAAAQTQTRLPDLSIEELLGVDVQPVFGASDRLQPATEAPASVTIVTAADIKRYGYRTLADILNSARGFYVTNDRNYSYVGVRGFNRPGDYNSRVLLLVNGHKINDNIYDQAYIGNELGIDAAMFARVEIIRGPASSLYGTSAFFAVVNVITKSGGAIDGVSVDADAGSLGTGLVRGMFGREFANGVSVAASATYERSTGMDRLYFPAYDAPDTNHGIAEDLDGERLADLYGQITWRGFSLTMIEGQRRKDIPTASYSTLFNSQDPKERTTDRHTMVHAQYDHTAGATRYVADVSFDRLAYTGTYPYEGDPETHSVPVLVNSDFSIGARWGFGAHATRALPGHQMLTIGGEFLANVTQKQWGTYNDPAEEGFLIDEPSNQSAFYVQDEIRVRPWLLLNAGVRHDRYEQFARTTPRGAIIVIPSANQSFKYLYGQAFRAPNAYELYYYADTSGSLRPETIATHELVWEQYVGEWLRTSVSAYRSHAEELLSFVALDATLDTFGFSNAGTIRSRGLELEGEVRTKHGLQLLASTALQRTDDEGGARLSNSPARMATVRVGAPGPLRDMTSAVELQYLGARDTLLGTTLRASTLVHVTFTARLTRDLELVGTIRNLFGHEHFAAASAEHFQDAILQNGRTARVGLRWSPGSH